MSEKKILDEIMDYFFNGDWKSFKEVEEFIEEKLKEYSDEKKKEIEKELYNELGEFYYENTNPLLAITPLRLSQILYKDAINLSKEVASVLKKSIEAKETVRDIALKLYEGYGFRDKEILKAKKVLPKYLKKAIEKKDKEIIKQIEKLKTKPLRIAYKDIVRNMDKLSDGALEKYIKTAYYEKMRYYAKRIADTETHRALMTKRAYEYLNDDNIEFVRFEMSSRHSKVDICDFYANLDIGYGRGIVLKKEMRTLPLHPHCHCIYAPYYGKVKGKRKPWKEAVQDTMNQFSEREQREILGTYAMLERFKAGEDIEKIFNTIRPKYPIQRYEYLFSKEKGIYLDLKIMLDEIKEKRPLTKDKIAVGKLDKKIIEFLEKRGVPVHTEEIYINHKGLSHLARESKRKRGAGLIEEDVLRIPKILENPSAVFFDESKDKLNLLYCDENDECKQMIKIVVDTKTIFKSEKMTLIKTAGYVKWYNIFKNKEYKQLK